MTSQGKALWWGAGSRAAAEVAAQGGVCGPPADGGRACPQRTRDAAVQLKPKPERFLEGWGEAQVQDIPPEERLFFLSPRFFTPFRESDTAPRVL